MGAAVGAFVLAGEGRVSCGLVPCCLVSKHPTGSICRVGSVLVTRPHPATPSLFIFMLLPNGSERTLTCHPSVHSVLAILVGWRVKRHRHNRKVWKRDLETARGKPAGSLEGSSDSNSSGGVAGKKPLAMSYVPFGVGSNDSVDATPHAKHATGLDAFAGQRRQRAEVKAGRSGRSTGHPLTDSAGGNNNMGTNMSG